MQALEVIRGLKGTNIIAADLVEVRDIHCIITIINF